jgi:hypothetical protein
MASCVTARASRGVLDRAFSSINIARVDAVLIERRRARRMLGQKLVPDIVKVADQRHLHVQLRQPLLDARHRFCRRIAINRNAHQLGAGGRQRRHLPRGRLDIGSIGVGH